MKPMFKLTEGREGAEPPPNCF